MTNKSWMSFPRTTIAFAALIMLLGGQVARAGEAASPAISPSAVSGPNASKEAGLGISARSLVAKAEADLAAGHPGLAIVQYERARLLAPRAPGVTDGLARARSTAGLPPAEASMAVRVATWLDANEWGWLAMAGLILAAASLVALSWGLIRRRGFLVLALAGGGLASVGLLNATEVTPPPGRAVVVAPETIARIAPFAGAEPAFLAPEGAIVTVERTHDNYAFIAGPEGHGWVPRTGVETILPAAEKGS